ncbi:hypothetical protein LEP1GSC170_4293 [Leptospira interrogans serovar Bataviae str. HAI135]|nr:hypothetical protein LEP1GSC170_4293 [Leptospira interrogans serovar Bataviae str. HAI135]
MKEIQYSNFLKTIHSIIFMRPNSKFENYNRVVEILAFHLFLFYGNGQLK